MNKGIFYTTAAALGLFVTGAASATPVTFFGQDQDPNVSTANSDAANAQFLSNLASGVGTEDFEAPDFADGDTAPFTLTFPGSTGSISATLTGSGASIDSGGTVGFAVYPTSGSQFMRTFQDFTLEFSSPVSAFGFYGTDIGDVSGDLVLTLSDGTTVSFTIPTSGSADGNQLFWGFIDLTEGYTKIEFGNSASGSDEFGFDDMTIGDLGQVNLVPEPGAMGMLGLGLLGLISLLLLRRRVSREV